MARIFSTIYGRRGWIDRYSQKRPCSLFINFQKVVPRRINNICRYAIIAAIEADSPTIDADIVQKSMEDEPI